LSRSDIMQKDPLGTSVIEEGDRMLAGRARGVHGFTYPEARYQRPPPPDVLTDYPAVCLVQNPDDSLVRHANYVRGAVDGDRVLPLPRIVRAAGVDASTIRKGELPVVDRWRM